MEYGCHRFNPDSANTDGLTQLLGQRPVRTRDNSLPTLLLVSGAILWEAEATWGVFRTLSICNKGFSGSGGSCSKRVVDGCSVAGAERGLQKVDGPCNQHHVYILFILKLLADAPIPFELPGRKLDHEGN